MQKQIVNQLKLTWTNKNGEKLFLSDINDTYLLNIFKMVKKGKNQLSIFLIQNELNKRGLADPLSNDDLIVLFELLIKRNPKFEKMLEENDQLDQDMKDYYEDLMDLNND